MALDRLTQITSVGITSGITLTGVTSVTALSATTILSTSATVGSAVTINSSGINAGIVTATNFSGNVTGNLTGNVTGNLTGNVTGNLNSTGVSTFTNGPVLIGSGTSTGTASQRLQVTGNAYVSGNIGIGITNPDAKLSVSGGINISSSGSVDTIIQRSIVPTGSYSLSISAGAGYTGEVYPIVIPTDAKQGAAIKLIGGDPTTDTYGGGICYYANGHTSPSSPGVGNQHVFFTRSAVNTYTERMRIDSSGNIGIGTNNPNSIRLNVTGAANKTSADNIVALTSNDSSNQFQLLFSRSASGSGAYYSLQSVEQSVAYRNLVLQQNGGNVSIGHTSPVTRLDVRGGNARIGGGYTRMVSGFKSVNVSSFTMFDITGIFREDLTEILIKHGHEGGGMHGSYRRWVFTSNASNATQTFEDTNNINYGGGLGFSFSFPTYGTLRITWGGASSFSQDFYMACFVRSRGNIGFVNQGMDSFDS